MACEEGLEDGPGFGEDAPVVDDRWRLAERVDRLERRRSPQRLGVPLVAAELVLQAELFEQPEDAMRAGVVEVMDGDHRLKARRRLRPRAPDG